MNPFDNTVFHFVNQFAGHYPIIDTFMTKFTEYSPELYGALFIIAWFALPKRDSKRRHALVVSVLSGVLALVINVIISHFIWFRQRPFVALPKGDYTQLVPHAPDASFPSDHSSGSWGFAAASWGKNTKWISYTFTIMAILVMISRVYDGIHWPTDVLAGMVVGIFSGRFMWLFSKWIYPLTSLGLRIFRYGEFSKRGSRKNVENDIM